MFEHFIERLELAVEQEDEMVLSRLEWNLHGPNPPADSSDPYAGMTPEFLTIVRELCRTPEEWAQLYIALLIDLARPESEARARLEALSGKLWMQTVYDGKTIWHVAFPPLDGGGSSQARVFLSFLKRCFPGRTFRTCFEWCCGPGFLGFSALWEGWCEELVLADINKAILPGVQRTIRENGLEGRVRAYVSDNLKSVPLDEKFDLVLGNPPWAYREIAGLTNPLIPNDPEWKVHRSFFLTVGERLLPDSQLFVSAYEPFLSEVYIEEQKEPWDVRLRPPIIDFREFVQASGLRLEEIYRPPYDPQVACCRGMTLLRIEQGEQGASVIPDLIGLGGRQALPNPEEFRFDLTLAQSLPVGEMVQRSIQMEAFEIGVSQGLADGHLTKVLKDLFGTPDGVSEPVLQRLGLSKPLVEAFEDWSDPTHFRYTPPVEGLRFAPETPFTEVSQLRLQLSQDAPVGVGLRLLKELLESLPKSLHFLLTVKPGFNEKSVRQFLERLPAYESERIEFFEHGHQTLFAQDNGRLAYRSDGAPVMLVPGNLSTHRRGDVLSAAPIPLVQSRLHWEGGNLLCDGRNVFIGANSVAASKRHLGLSEEQVRQALSAESGYPVTILGDVDSAFQKLLNGERGTATPHALDGGQADFHIDLDCCLLGEDPQTGTPRVILADPEMGLNFLDEVLHQDRLFRGHCLPPDQSRDLFTKATHETVLRRVPLLNGYADTFKALGYQVVRVPDLRLVSDFNLFGRVNTTFGYCNALPLQIDGLACVCLLSCGLPELESEVFRIYGEQGVKVVWVGDRHLAEDLLGMRGGLHCFCSLLETVR